MPRKILGYVVLFLICTSFALIMTPSVVEAANFSTTADIWVEPYTIGVGQKVEISMWVTPPPPTGNVFHNYRVIITKPDGVNETLGPFTSDNTGFAATYYVPQQVGTFHAQFFFQREVFNAGDSYNASVSTSTTFIVQQNPVSLHLTVAISGSGSTYPVPGVHSYNPGDNVSVTALPAPGWNFSYWALEEGSAGSSNPYNLTMFADWYLEAVFTQIQYSLNNTVTGSGTTNPSPGIHQYASGTVVNVSATPNSGWMLSSLMLNGVNVGSVSPYYLLMDANKTLTAVFTPIPYSLNITVTGSGTTNPALGIHQYTPGTVVSVNATPGSGWRFGYWMLNGVNVSSVSPYSVTMDANKTLTAVFTQTPYNLNITVTGSGTTNPTPGVHQYLSGTIVSASATPTSGWTLSSWILNGVNVGSGSPYSVTMDANKTLTAVFTQTPYTLSTIVTGSGSISPSPGTYQYASGTVVDVNAIPATGWMLSYWSLNGVNVGDASSYAVSMNADCTLTAVFVQQPSSTVRLTINVSGSGNTNPAVGDHDYNMGSTVKVTAQPNINWSFNCWLLNNNNVSTTPEYPLTMNGDYSLVAVFQPQNFSPSAVIDSIGPNSSSAGQKVTLVGHGDDPDGVVTGYRWVSNIDGLLSTSPSFSTTNLSVGTHTISFEVQDNDGDWSVKSEQVIAIEAATSLSLLAISVAVVAGSIGVTASAILFRDKLSRFFRSKGRFRKDTKPRDDNGNKEENKKKKQNEKGSLELKATLPSRIMESQHYEAKINIKNTGNSNVKDILISAQATPGILISKSEKKVSSLRSGKNCDQVFPFEVEKKVDRGYYVLRFDVKSRITHEQTKSGWTSAVKIGFLSNLKNAEHEVYRHWLREHSYAWDELSSADDLCNCLLNYDLLIVPPEMELKKQWANNLSTFVKGGQSLLFMSNARSAETELLAKTLGYAEMSYENSSSSQRPIRVLNQHPIVSEFSSGQQLTLKNCMGNVCVSKNSTTNVIAEYTSLNGKFHIPAIMVNEEKGKVVYLNFQAKDSSPQFDTLLRNTIEWLLEPKGLLSNKDA